MDKPSKTDQLQLFFVAERVQYIASTINWRLSCQRFYALICPQQHRGSYEEKCVSFVSLYHLSSSFVFVWFGFGMVQRLSHLLDPEVKYEVSIQHPGEP